MANQFELLIDATNVGIDSKRRFESQASNIESLIGEITFALNVTTPSSSLFLEVWDSEFEEWVLLNEINKQISGKAKVRLLSKDLSVANKSMVDIAKPQSAPMNPPLTVDTSQKTIPPSTTQTVPFSNSGSTPFKNKAGRIEVEQYVINFGLDLKFQDDPGQGISPLNLHGMLTKKQYQEAISKINDQISIARATPVDIGLLATGTMMLPLIPFGIRNYRRKKDYKKRLISAIDEFNYHHPKLEMKWLKHPLSQLVIEWKEVEDEEHGTASVPSNNEKAQSNSQESRAASLSVDALPQEGQHLMDFYNDQRAV